MSIIINGNFQDLNAAKRALSDLLNTGFTEAQTSCFSVTLPGRDADTHTSEGTVAALDDAAAAAPEAADGALSGAAVGGAIGVAVAIAALPVLGPIVAAAALGVGAYGGSLYGVLGSLDGAEGKATESSNVAIQNAPYRQSGIVVAAVADDEVQQDTAKRILHSHGAHDIELREGTLSLGVWTDFNPRLPLQRLPV